MIRIGFSWLQKSAFKKSLLTHEVSGPSYFRLKPSVICSYQAPARKVNSKSKGISVPLKGGTEAPSTSSVKGHLAKLLEEDDDGAIAYDLPKEDVDGSEEGEKESKRRRKKMIDFSNDLRVLVIQPVEPTPHKKEMGITATTPHYNLQEAVGLVDACMWKSVHTLITPLPKVNHATYFGSGKLNELKGVVADSKCDVVYVNAFLTPLQQRKLTEAFSQSREIRVIDRFAVILEIFSLRAESKEAKLQVRLAWLQYQKTFLVGKHSSQLRGEQQRGYRGTLAGAGEKQLEIDRRRIEEETLKVKKNLDLLLKARDRQTQTRTDKDYSIPSVAVVGYTNAGKSLLINTLTKNRAQLQSRDQLFTSLSPFFRGKVLPSGMKVLLLDTVGFVSNLPHELFSAFKATLDEVKNASILLHVRDIAHIETEFQKANVLKVLKELKLDPRLEKENSMEVWNKMDLLPEEMQLDLMAQANHQPNVFPTSALYGHGLQQLLEAVDIRIQQMSNTRVFELTVPLLEQQHIAYLYSDAHVLEQDQDEKQNAILKVLFSGPGYDIYRSKFTPLRAKRIRKQG